MSGRVALGSDCQRPARIHDAADADHPGLFAARLAPRLRLSRAIQPGFLGRPAQADRLLCDRNSESLARGPARRRLSVRRGHGRDARIRGGATAGRRTWEKMVGLPVARAGRLADLSIQRHRFGPNHAHRLARHRLRHGLYQGDRYTPSPRAAGPDRKSVETEKTSVIGAILIPKSKLNLCSDPPGVYPPALAYIMSFTRRERRGSIEDGKTAIR